MRQFDKTGRLTRDERYGYDLAGNRLAKQRDGVTVDYSLGTGNRLTAWTLDPGASLFTVDVYGQANETLAESAFASHRAVSNSLAIVQPVLDGSRFHAAGLPAAPGPQQVHAVVADFAGNRAYMTNAFTLVVVTNTAFAYNPAGTLTAAVARSTAGEALLTLDRDSQYR